MGSRALADQLLAELLRQGRLDARDPAASLASGKLGHLLGQGGMLLVAMHRGHALPAATLHALLEVQVVLERVWKRHRDASSGTPLPTRRGLALSRLT